MRLRRGAHPLWVAPNAETRWLVAGRVVSFLLVARRAVLTLSLASPPIKERTRLLTRPHSLPPGASSHGPWRPLAEPFRLLRACARGNHMRAALGVRLWAALPLAGSSGNGGGAAAQCSLARTRRSRTTLRLAPSHAIQGYIPLNMTHCTPHVQGKAWRGPSRG